MKLEDQVCNLELAKRLKELGVRQESHFWWQTTNTTAEGEKCRGLTHDPQDAGAFFKISAFTVAELGEMLPPMTEIFREENLKDFSWTCRRDAGGGYLTVSGGHSEAEARARMLIHLIEEGIVKP